MAFEFKLPDLGENIESGDVVSLLVAAGDHVNVEQPLIEMETDKAVIEIPSPKAGRIEKIHVSPGDTVKIGDVLVTIDVDADAGAEAAAASAEGASAREEAAAADSDETTALEGQEEAAAAQQRAPAARQKRTGGNQSAQKPQRTADDDGRTAAAGPGTTAAGRRAAWSPPGAGTAPAGPATRRLARQLGVDLSRVAGSGSGGRITEEDVMRAVRENNRADRRSGAAAAPARRPAPARRAGVEDEDAWGPIRRERLTKIRTTIATNMAHSASTIPHVTNFDDADITELEKIRKGTMADYVGSNVKLTMMSFVMKAVALSLRKHPTLNASIDMDEGEIVYKEYVNLGVAVDTERGLIVPVLRDVDEMRIPEIAEGLMRAAEQGRSGKFAIEDLRGGTFTISNLGAVGGIYSTPIINHPQVAVLLLGRSRRLPIVIEDRIEPRLIMPLSLSYDHRLVDGATAARFLNEVIGLLETPGRLLLAP